MRLDADRPAAGVAGAESPHHELRRHVRRGGVLIFAAQGFKFLIQFGSVIALARLLPPSAFGLIAMVAALNAVLDLVKELGLSSATIQRPDISHAQINALFWINAGAGALIALVLAAAAPLVALFYHQPELVPITRWLALGFFISGLTIQHWALLRRRMQFGAVALVDTASDLSGVAAAIVLALSGAGYWSLVALRLVPLTVNLLGSWIACDWRPSRPRAAPIRDLVAFGLAITGSNVVAAFARSMDQILIGWMWGPVSLGFYERASKLLLVPINNINIPIFTVGFPALSRIAADRDRFRAAACSLYRRLAMATMPGAALIACTGDWTTGLLFGPAWHGAEPLVTCFGAVCAVQPSILAFSLICMAESRGRALFRLASLDAALTVLSFLCGLHFGALGVAAAFAACSIAIRLPVAIVFATRRSAVRPRDLTQAILPSLVAGLAVAGVVLALRAAVPELGAAGAISGYLPVAPAALIAAIAIFMAFPMTRSDLFKALRLIHPRRRAPIGATARYSAE